MGGPPPPRPPGWRQEPCHPPAPQSCSFASEAVGSTPTKPGHPASKVAHPSGGGLPGGGLVGQGRGAEPGARL